MNLSLYEVISIGSVFSGFGALSTWALVHTKSIESLKNSKQDKEVCEVVSSTLKADITEIKSDVKELLRIKRNGG